MQLAKEEITNRAAAIVATIQSQSRQGVRPQAKLEVLDGESLIGGGSAPSAVLPTTLISVTCYSLSASEVAARLRASDPPVIARVEDGRVLLDLRTVFPAQDEMLTEVLSQILAVNTAI